MVNAEDLARNCECPFVGNDMCSDDRALRASSEVGRVVDKDLADQHYELCQAGGYTCSTRVRLSAISRECSE